MVSKHKECYVITDSMCYWYAFMVVEVAKTYYSSTPKNPNGTHSICSMLSGLNVLPSQNVPPEVPPDTDVVSDLPPRAGYYRWVNMSKTWMEELDIVAKKYEDERRANPKPIPATLKEQFSEVEEQGLKRGREERREEVEQLKEDAERAKENAERERQLRLKVEEQLRALLAQ